MIITKCFHDIGGRKYIEIDNCKIKVPWRYNRVDGVEIKGTTLPIQMLSIDTVISSLEFTTKKWNGKEYKVLKSITI